MKTTGTVSAVFKLAVYSPDIVFLKDVASLPHVI